MGGVKSFSCKTQPVRLRLGWGFDNYVNSISKNTKIMIFNVKKKTVMKLLIMCLLNFAGFPYLYVYLLKLLKFSIFPLTKYSVLSLF